MSMAVGRSALAIFLVLLIVIGVGGYYLDPAPESGFDPDAGYQRGLDEGYDEGYADGLAEVPPDTDGDGVPDEFDVCPTEAGLPEFGGCLKPPKIAVVSDVGGRGDLSFNDMAFKGGEEAERDFGVEMVEIISSTEADYVPNLRMGALDPDVVLVVGVGFMLGDAIGVVAADFPDMDFMGIDTFVPGMPNLLNVLFEEHKGSALVGALGALVAAHYEKPYIGGVFGIEIPVLWKFEVGYKWGVNWAMQWYEDTFGTTAPGIGATPPKERVLYTYTGTFEDQQLGYLATVPMLEQGAAAVFNIAGPVGLGINSAIQDWAEAESLESGPPFMIGVDANQDWLNPGFIVASMMKRVDRGVYLATELVFDGTFRDVVEEYGGIIVLGIGTEVSGISIDGISVSTLADLDEFIAMGVSEEQRTGTPILPGTPEEIRAGVEAMRNALPDWIWEAVDELAQEIADGEVEVPECSFGCDIGSYRDIYG